MDNSSYQYIYHTVLKLLLLGLVITFMIVAQHLLIPFIIAVFFTFLLLPFSIFLEKKKIPRWLAIMVSLIMASTIVGGLFYFFYLQIISFADDWPVLKESIEAKMDNMYAYIRENFHISKGEQRIWVNNKLIETVTASDEFILNIFSATGAFLANLALIPIYVFFLTFYREKIKLFIALVIKDGGPIHLLPMLSKVATVSQKYLKGIFLDVLILSVLNSIGFLLLDLKHAILFGVLAAMLNIIPYIGVVVGSILPVAMALLTKEDISYALGAAGTCVVVQFLDNNFITPYVVGSSVSINPLAAIIALLVSAMIWGIPGMVLCIPLVGMIKVVCDNVENLRPYGFLIGEEKEYKT